MPKHHSTVYTHPLTRHSLIHSLIHTHSLTHSSLTHSLTHTHSLTLTHSLTHSSLTHLLTLTHTHSLTHYLLHTITHSLTYHSFTHSHTHTHTHSHSLTHTHTHSLTHTHTLSPYTPAPIHSSMDSVLVLLRLHHQPDPRWIPRHTTQCQTHVGPGGVCPRSPHSPHTTGSSQHKHSSGCPAQSIGGCVSGMCVYITTRNRSCVPFRPHVRYSGSSDHILRSIHHYRLDHESSMSYNLTSCLLLMVSVI